MNTSETNDFVIALHGRIDSLTAAAADDYITENLKGCSSDQVTLDMEDVPYISSAGLRVILKFKKKYNSLRIINALPAVYEVFEVTGFTNMLTIQKAFREISVDGCEILGQGGHGTVYRIDGDTIIKVYGEKESLEEIQREINYARNAFVYGIPTAIAFDVVKCQGHYGAVFELINADTLGNAIRKEPDKFEEYKEQYLKLIDILHTTEVDITKFESIKDLYNQWIEDARSVYDENEIDVLHRIVNSVPDRKTLVHGDIHPKNVMVQNGELVLIDMADITFGHPIFDFAGMGLTHWIMATRTPERAISIVGLEAEKVINLWEAVLKHTFGHLPEEEQDNRRKLIEKFIMLKYALAPAVNKNMPDEMKQNLVKSARMSFFPIAESLVGMIKE